MLEIVTDADTITRIQKSKAGALSPSAFSRQSLYKWLSDYNDTEEK